jgi:hypothetical protein
MKKISKTLRTSLALVMVAAAFTACKKDDDLVPVPPPVENEGEVITTLTLTFTDVANVQPTVTATFRDPDGDGGNGPDIQDTIRLMNGTTYDVAVQVLDETTSPIGDITAEILEEDHEHLICFSPTGANVTIVRTDTDGTYEVGLQSRWTAGAASTGTVQVELKHQPDIKDGTCAVGETDIDVTYVTEIQ